MPQKRRSILATLLIATTLLACSAESDDGSGGKNNGGAGSSGSFGNPSNAGTTSSGAGTTGSTSVGGGMGCASANIDTSRITPTIWLVIDGSGSMSESFGASDRWTELRAALMDMTGGVVPRLQGAVNWGMVMYDGPIDFGAILGGFLGGGMAGTGGATTCPRLTVVDPAKGNAMAIDGAYPQEPPGGSTPTHIALQEVLPRVQNPPPDPDGTVSPIYVVLATDGAPNDFCSGGIGADASAKCSAPRRPSKTPARRSTSSRSRAATRTSKPTSNKLR
jgi:hypothetical protein